MSNVCVLCCAAPTPTWTPSTLTSLNAGCGVECACVVFAVPTPTWTPSTLTSPNAGCGVECMSVVFAVPTPTWTPSTLTSPNAGCGVECMSLRCCVCSPYMQVVVSNVCVLCCAPYAYMDPLNTNLT